MVLPISVEYSESSANLHASKMARMPAEKVSRLVIIEGRRLFDETHCIRERYSLISFTKTSCTV